MTIDDKIRDEKLLYDINGDAAKILESWLGKIDKYEFLAGDDIWFSAESRVISLDKLCLFVLLYENK